MNFNYSSLNDVLPDVDYFVEADSFSQLALWKDYHHRPDEKVKPVPWQQIMSGYLRTLPGGTSVSFSFAYLFNDKLVCFYYPTSRKVDWDHVETFLEPFWKSKEPNGRRRRCDAMNFGHCLGYCKNQE